MSFVYAAGGQWDTPPPPAAPQYEPNWILVPSEGTLGVLEAGNGGIIVSTVRAQRC